MHSRYTRRAKRISLRPSAMLWANLSPKSGIGYGFYTSDRDPNVPMASSDGSANRAHAAVPNRSRHDRDKQSFSYQYGIHPDNFPYRPACTAHRSKSPSKFLIEANRGWQSACHDLRNAKSNCGYTPDRTESARCLCYQ